MLGLLYGPPLTSIRDYWKNHSLDCTSLCWQSNVSATSIIYCWRPVIKWWWNKYYFWLFVPNLFGSMQGLVNGSFHILRRSSSLYCQHSGHPTLHLAFLAMVCWGSQVNWKLPSSFLFSLRISGVADLPQLDVLIPNFLEMSLCHSDLAEVLIKIWELLYTMNCFFQFEIIPL